MSEEVNDTVMVKTHVKFRPWQVPRFAIVAAPARPRQEGFQEAPKIPVPELDSDVLDALAQRWLDNLYALHATSSPWKMSRPA